MTIFRFSFVNGDWKLRLAMVSVVIGFLGFFACWTTLALGERRVFSNAMFATPGQDRPVAIEAKGQTYLVEASYGYRYNLAQNAIFFIWALAAVGGFYVNRREKKDAAK